MEAFLKYFVKRRNAGILIQVKLPGRIGRAYLQLEDVHFYVRKQFKLAVKTST